MLSKVLNPRAGESAKAALFAPVLPGTSLRGGLSLEQQAPGGVDPLQAALDRIRRLEGEVIAARREAFEAGRTQGEEQTRLELAPVLDRMSSSVAEITCMRAEMRRLAEKDVVHLSLLIARRVLHRELSVDVSALTALARVIFERLARAESYRVVVNPRFAEAIRSALPGNQLSRVQIDPDASVDQGTLIVRSEEGLIDASIDVQLEEIGRGLTDRLSIS